MATVPVRTPLAAAVAAVPAGESALVAVDRATGELRRGGAVVLHDGQGTALLVQAAETVEGDRLGRLRGLSQGDPVLVLTAERAKRLGLGTGGTGVLLHPLPASVAPGTIRRLADPLGEPGGSLPFEGDAPPLPRGFADAAIALTKLARLLPAAVLAPLAGRTRNDLAGWAARQDLLCLHLDDIALYPASAAYSLRLVAEAPVPLADAEEARVLAFRPSDGGAEHLAILIGDPPRDAPVLTRLHSECFTGDILGSLRCDCGDQLRGALAAIGRAGSGLLLYLAQEGRGIGLVNKLRAYALQDRGADTLEANQQLGFDADERVYLPAAEMLRQLGFARVRLMTNNPDKVAALAHCGIEVVERVPHIFPSNRHNDRYLETKAARLGHLF